MALLVRKTFLLKRDPDDSYLSWQMLNVRPPYNGGICHMDLLYFFDLPEAVTRINISLHSCNARNRVKAEVDKGWFGEPTITVGTNAVSSPEFDRCLRPLDGKTVYIEVRYDTDGGWYLLRKEGVN